MHMYIYTYTYTYTHIHIYMYMEIYIRRGQNSQELPVPPTDETAAVGDIRPLKTKERKSGE